MKVFIWHLFYEVWIVVAESKEQALAVLDSRLASGGNALDEYKKRDLDTIKATEPEVYETPWADAFDLG
jgi:hypothetical protein